jgi:hypothetical protein
MKKALIILGLTITSLFVATGTTYAQVSDYACEMNPPYGVVVYQETGHGAAVATCQYMTGQALTNYCASVGNTDPWQVGVRVWYYSAPFWEQIWLENYWVQCVNGSLVVL